MRIILIWITYLAIQCGALMWSHSTSGWVVLGLAPVLWLDRYVFRELPWPGTVKLGPGLLLRIAFFLPVAMLLWKFGMGMVTVCLAVVTGVVFSLFMFLLELAFDLGQHLAGYLGRNAPIRPGLRISSLVIMLVLAGGIGFLWPLSAFHPLGLTPNQTPAHLGLDYEDVHLQTADGLELTGWLIPCPEAKGSIIWCHGHCGHRQQVLSMVKDLHSMGLNVLACDFRGHGDSPGNTAAFGRREVPDVLTAEAFLARRFPDKPIFIMGVSYGAAVTMQALPKLQHVKGAWIESSFTRLSDVAENQFDRVPATWRKPLIYAYSVLIWLDTGCWMLEANPIDHQSPADLPILFCHGVDDGLIPFAQGRALFAECRSSRKECYWIENGGHGNLQREGGENYFRRMRVFFEERLREEAEGHRSVQ